MPAMAASTRPEHPVDEQAGGPNLGAYLVVAGNPTGDGQLLVEIRRRVARGPSSFVVLVPVPESEVQRHGGLHAMVAGEAGPLVVEADLPRRVDAERQALEQRAAGRLDGLTREIRAAGAESEGSLCESDILRAIGIELRIRSFDEIILSIPHPGPSRWLHLDLPHRISRRFGLPVRIVRYD
jgi:hypothetical protein